MGYLDPKPKDITEKISFFLWGFLFGGLAGLVMGFSVSILAPRSWMPYLAFGCAVFFAIALGLIAAEKGHGFWDDFTELVRGIFWPWR